MNKILLALERQNTPAAGNQGPVIASLVESMGRAKLESDISTQRIAELSAQVASLTAERDELLASGEARDLDVEQQSTELGALRERCQTLEDRTTQIAAELALERSSIDMVTGASDESIGTLKAQLADEREKSANLSGALDAMKKLPAPVQQVMPTPIDYGGMEFSVGSIVRGPDGIQEASIKLVKAN